MWKARSLRFWLALGLALAILPLGVSAVAGHIILHHDVMDAFADVTDRHRYELAPLQGLRVALTEAVVPVDEFLDDGDPVQPPLYRGLRERIEAAFAAVPARLPREDVRALVARARDDWAEADRAATEAMSVRRSPGSPEGVVLMQRIHGRMAAAVDKLAAVSTDLEAELAVEHDRALLAYERSEWILAIAAGISGLAVILSIVIIGRIVSSSVDRLVVGAERFASGDRQHRIDVQVPPELHRVADEFNRMILRIHESEAALEDLARRDGLTKLLNRRAFGDALDEVFARVARTGEAGALLMLDVDHFKAVNDTHGHGAGDDVLRAVAGAMVSDVRLVDHVFRVGGEEFAVLLAAVGPRDAAATADRLRQAVAELRIRVRGGELRPTVSIGVALTGDRLDPAALIEAADAALYQAKRQGRDRVVVASPPPETSGVDVAQETESL